MTFATHRSLVQLKMPFVDAQHMYDGESGSWRVGSLARLLLLLMLSSSSSLLLLLLQRSVHTRQISRCWLSDAKATVCCQPMTCRPANWLLRVAVQRHVRRWLVRFVQHRLNSGTSALLRKVGSSSSSPGTHAVVCFLRCVRGVRGLRTHARTHNYCVFGIMPYR